MNLSFDINEEINRIGTGNTVLVSGLYGKEFKFINNKFGFIKKIYIRIDGEDSTHIADVELFENKKTYSVNFDYIFKLILKRRVDNISQHVITIDNPLIYYSKKKSLLTYMNFSDEFGQQMSICTDKNGKSHVLLFSGIN